MGTLSKGTLFPPQLTNELFNLVRGKSSLARLSQQKPLPFNGTEVFTFNFDNEVDVIAENGAKGVGGATIQPITIQPVKVEYGTRISDEFVYASDEVRLGYLRAFSEGFAAKAARGLDIMALHGYNPRTMTASAVIGNNHFDYQISKSVTRTASPDADVESAIALVMNDEHEVTGMAMSPAFRSALAAMRKTDGTPVFPELQWGQGGNDTIRGLAVDTNSTMSVNSTVNKDAAIVGNFRDYFRYGISRQVSIETILYGNPDNSADGDLKGHNQVYLRGELYIGWGILVPGAFSKIVSGE